MRRFCRVFVAFALCLGVAGCGESTAAVPPDATSLQRTTTSSSAPTSSSVDMPVSQQSSAFVSVVDGDTIETSAGRVRIIGIDTPEVGQCGYGDASHAISEVLSAGDPITLELPKGENDVDKYGRLLRYVVTADGSDIGLRQIEAGYAAPRYDSTDGYPAHPQEEKYHAAAIAYVGPNGVIVTPNCPDQVAPPDSVAGQAPSDGTDEHAGGTAETTASADPWWTKYSSCSKLKKNTVGDPTGPFNRDNPGEADIYNWFQYGTGHRGDGDGDGLACE